MLSTENNVYSFCKNILLNSKMIKVCEVNTFHNVSYLNRYFKTEGKPEKSLDTLYVEFVTSLNLIFCMFFAIFIYSLIREYIKYRNSLKFKD